MALIAAKNQQVRESAPDDPVVISVALPRQSDRTLLSVQNMMGSLIGLGAFSLDVVGDFRGIRLMARCQGRMAASFRRALVGYYPQSRLDAVAPESDPLLLAPGEVAFSRSLRVEGLETLPIMTYDDSDIAMSGSDPILGLMGAMSSLREGERVLARLALRGLPRDWASEYRLLAMSGAGSVNQTMADQERAAAAQSEGGIDMVLLLPVIALGYVGFQAYSKYSQGDTFGAALWVGGSLAAAAAGGYVYFRFLKPKPPVYMDPRQVELRVSGAAFEAEAQLTVIQGAEWAESRAYDLLDDLSAAYAHFDNPIGSTFKQEETVRGVPEHYLKLADVGAQAPHPTGLAALGTLFKRQSSERSMLGAKEISALWHPTAAADETHSMERRTFRSIPPAYNEIVDGALVGENESGGVSRPVFFPDSALRSHHLYVASTRMGKSTMMRHIVEHKMRQKALGLDDDAIVVIDPHSDLVHGLMELCPPEIADQVRVIDLGDPDRVPGINLLDTAVFSDRDLTCDGIVHVAKGLWENWGSRMQNILEHLVKSLHEANSSMSDREKQYTLLDGHEALGSTREHIDFRNKLLRQVDDPYLKRWWRQEFEGWDDRLRTEACAPVQTRLAYYGSSIRARRIIGQPKSTLDIRETIQGGGILLVATSQAFVGRDVASLLGACVLNLVDAVIRNQGVLPPSERRGCLVVVDEMQSIPGVDYEGMLGEVGKFGGSLVVATQSLTKLDELSETMRDTLLANVSCLCAFRVSGTDATRLRVELGADRIEEHDIVGLPRHHCYARIPGPSGDPILVSMKVRPPSEGDPESFRAIRAEMPAYTRSVAEVDRLLRDRVSFGEEGESLEVSAGSGSAGGAGKSRPQSRQNRSARGRRESGGSAAGTRKNSHSNR